MRVGAFKDFITDYRHVADCIQKYAPQPWTSDPVMNAYDFRPSGTGHPSTYTLEESLKELGAFRPKGMDHGIFVYTLTCTLKHATRLSHHEAEHLIRAYAAYRRLSDGRIRKWKLHKTNRKPRRGRY